MQPHTPKCIIIEFSRIWAYITLTLAYIAGVFVAYIMATDMLSLLIPFKIALGLMTIPFLMALWFLFIGLVSEGPRSEIWRGFLQGLEILVYVMGAALCIIGIFAGLGFLCELLPWWTGIASAGIIALATTIFCAAAKCGYI
jgi:hypothetical protein